MKKLLIAVIAASLGTPVLAAPLGHPSIPPTEVHDETHAGGFYQDVITRSKPAPVKEEPKEEQKAVVAANDCAPLWGGATENEKDQAQTARAADKDDKDRAGAIVPLPPACSGMGLATPLYGQLTVGEAVGIGAAVVAIGAAIGNHGGGGGHHNSGTTGTTK
ncbi:hypothetical protein FEA48_08155 [Pseudomonas nitroreducens]|uniref:Uncharacterized protein n=1 Tax=Pseudomonas nitroreducens TaxID=46680 RepID=A0A5R9AC54_PSENT|nr:hypothetical protein [Pseudomonas nitroreducens]TLP76362.1 hypothetical protein FEA48_08155 [Pseudomonas nitroreducens]